MQCKSWDLLIFVLVLAHIYLAGLGCLQTALASSSSLNGVCKTANQVP